MAGSPSADSSPHSRGSSPQERPEYRSSASQSALALAWASLSPLPALFVRRPARGTGALRLPSPGCCRRRRRGVVHRRQLAADQARHRAGDRADVPLVAGERLLRRHRAVPAVGRVASGTAHQPYGPACCGRAATSPHCGHCGRRTTACRRVSIVARSSVISEPAAETSPESAFAASIAARSSAKRRPAGRSARTARLSAAPLRRKVAVASSLSSSRWRRHCQHALAPGLKRGPTQGIVPCGLNEQPLPACGQRLLIDRIQPFVSGSRRRRRCEQLTGLHDAQAGFFHHGRDQLGGRLVQEGNSNAGSGPGMRSSGTRVQAQTKRPPAREAAAVNEEGCLDEATALLHPHQGEQNVRRRRLRQESRQSPRSCETHPAAARGGRRGCRAARSNRARSAAPRPATRRLQHGSGGLTPAAPITVAPFARTRSPRHPLAATRTQVRSKIGCVGGWRWTVRSVLHEAWETASGGEGASTFPWKLATISHAPKATARRFTCGSHTLPGKIAAGTTKGHQTAEATRTTARAAKEQPWTAKSR